MVSDLKIKSVSLHLLNSWFSTSTIRTLCFSKDLHCKEVDILHFLILPKQEILSLFLKGFFFSKKWKSIPKSSLASVHGYHAETEDSFLGEMALLQMPDPHRKYTKVCENFCVSLAITNKSVISFNLNWHTPHWLHPFWRKTLRESKRWMIFFILFT